MAKKQKQRGRGRPPKRTYDRVLQIRLTSSEVAALEQLARKDGRSMAGWIRQAIRLAMAPNLIIESMPEAD